MTSAWSSTLPRLRVWIGLDGRRESIKRGRPHRFERLGEGTQGLAVGPIEALIAGAPNVDEARIPEDPEMLRHGPERHIELGSDVAGRPLAIPDQSEDLAPARLADDLQCVHVSILAMVEIVLPGR